MDRGRNAFAFLLIVFTTYYLNASENVKFLPQKFLGSWESDADKTLDEFLKSRGDSWLKRQFTKLYAKFSDFDTKMVELRHTITFKHKGHGVYYFKFENGTYISENDDWRLDIPISDLNTNITTTISYNPTTDSITCFFAKDGEPTNTASISVEVIDGYLIQELKKNGELIKKDDISSSTKRAYYKRIA